VPISAIRLPAPEANELPFAVTEMSYVVGHAKFK
jgi:hypothetical protein